MKKDNSKPLMLYVAEKIYHDVSKIKKNNPDITLIEAIEMFSSTKEYIDISSGKYHAKLFQEIKDNSNLAEQLECLYYLNDRDNFYKKLDLAINQSIISPKIASLSSHASIRYSRIDNYSFCKDPLNFILRFIEFISFNIRFTSRNPNS